MDSNGSCDSYCILKQGSCSFKTRTIRHSLEPKWRQDFAFPIKDLSDIVTVTVFDFDSVGKDDLIGGFEICARDFRPGSVLDERFNCSSATRPEHPIVRCLVHLALPDHLPFVDHPFTPWLAHVRVMYLIATDRHDSTGFSVSLALLPGGLRQETSALDRGYTPDWSEEFHFLITSPTDCTLKMALLSKNTVIGETTVPLTQLSGDRPTKQTFPLGGTNSIRICGHVAPMDIAPFANEEDDVYPVMSKMELHLHIIEGRNLQSADANGLSDPYVNVFLTGNEKCVMRTRKVKETLNPKWNQHFAFDVKSFGQESLVFEVYDWDAGGEDDKIGFASRALKDFQFGVPTKKEFWLDHG
jgi:Ca2+-dependent lipid-binding protein